MDGSPREGASLDPGSTTFEPDESVRLPNLDVSRASSELTARLKMEVLYTQIIDLSRLLGFVLPKKARRLAKAFIQCVPIPNRGATCDRAEMPT